MSVPFQLKPTMASRKLAALTLITGYVREHGGSPSYGEIAASFRPPLSRQHAKTLVAALVEEGLVSRVTGSRRGIVLPGEKERAIAQLRAAGYAINEEARTVTMPIGADPFTFPPLPVLPALDHIPDVEIGGAGGRTGGAAAGAMAAAASSGGRGRAGDPQGARGG